MGVTRPWHAVEGRAGARDGKEPVQSDICALPTRSAPNARVW